MKKHTLEKKKREVGPVPPSPIITPKAPPGVRPAPERNNPIHIPEIKPDHHPEIGPANNH